MDLGKTNAGVWVAAGVIGILALVAGIALFVVYTGAFNVAATEDHTSLTRWAFDTAFRNSVERRASGSTAPGDITPAMVEAGASAYKSMCQHCHAGPGVEREKWASGMRPRPPHLTEAAARWEIHQIFWIAKHGVKMTGMPAFGPSHEDQTLWGIAAFVSELPAMSPERYKQIGGTPEHGHNDGGSR
jgi:mono/diheme cytochrome c family protein